MTGGLLTGKLLTGREGGAVYLRMASSLFYSFGPLTAELSQAAAYPFLYNAVWRLATALGLLVLMVAAGRGWLMRLAVWRLLAGRLGHWRVALSCLSVLDMVMFSVALRTLDSSVVTLGFGLSPIVFALVVWGSYRGISGGRYRLAVGPLTFLMMLLAFGGFALVVASERGLELGPAGGTGLAVGLGAVLVGMVLTALIAASLRWAIDAADAAEGSCGVCLGPGGAALLAALFAAVAANLLGALVSVGAGLALGERPAAGLLVAGTLGLVVNPCGGFLLRWSSLRARNLGVNAISYFTPLFALPWLGLAGFVDVRSVPLLISGAVVIVGSNLAVYLAPSRRRSSVLGRVG